MFEVFSAEQVIFSYNIISKMHVNAKFLAPLCNATTIEIGDVCNKYAIKRVCSGLYCGFIGL